MTSNGGVKVSHKFTSDGRKVAVIGALNAQETIVQEVFVTDGTEFPAGEHFVVKTLLDTPAETYKVKEERRALESIKKLEAVKDNLELEIKDLKSKAQAATAKIKWIAGVTEREVEDVFDNLRAMMCGEYTHVVFPGHVEIREWDHDLFVTRDDYHHGFESLRLISLFGEWNGRLKLDWKVNTYRDGSGSATSFIPCKSLQEAVDKAKGIIYNKEYLCDKDHEFCLAYGIPVDETKNAVRLGKKSDYIKKQISDNKERLAKLEADLSSII